jgi:hypothetical protein
MNKILILNFLVLFFSACQLAPTKVKNEVGGTANPNVVYADTRSALAHSTYHPSGTVSLNTDDFIILKNAATQERVLDPDLDQLVERLAKRGISPLKKVKLISNKKDSEENKKWKWLLSKLDVNHVEFLTLDEYIQQNRPLRPQPEPERANVWPVPNAAIILTKSQSCFVNWSDADCL